MLSNFIKHFPWQYYCFKWRYFQVGRAKLMKKKSVKYFIHPSLPIYIVHSTRSRRKEKILFCWIAKCTTTRIRPYWFYKYACYQINYTYQTFIFFFFSKKRNTTFLYFLYIFYSEAYQIFMSWKIFTLKLKSTRFGSRIMNNFCAILAFVVNW